MKTGLSFTDEFSLDANSPAQAETSSAEPVTMPRDLASYPEDIRVEVNRRLEYLNWVREHLDGGWTEAKLCPLLKQAAAEIAPPPPNWRTLARWWKK